MEFKEKVVSFPSGKTFSRSVRADVTAGALFTAARRLRPPAAG